MYQCFSGRVRCEIPMKLIATDAINPSVKLELPFSQVFKGECPVSMAIALYEIERKVGATSLEGFHRCFSLRIPSRSKLSNRKKMMLRSI